MRILLILLVVCGLGAGGFTAYSFYQWRAPSVAADVETVITPGTGTRGILKQLNVEGTLPEPWKIILPFLIEQRGKSLKAGEYGFTEGMSPAQVLSQIARGKVLIHKVTVPEGYSVSQVRALLLAEPLLTGELPAKIAEGSLFPDTWLFQRGDTRVSVVGRMQSRMREELAKAWEGRDASLPLRSPEEALTLASIVEEETGVADERPLVAGVYLNRLRLPMRLQSDPTVAYGVNPRGMTRPLTTGDLGRDTPYNTYTRDGLPPGPISNPGLAAIRAVMQPASTKALYFVATGEGGGHRFAETLREHEANVRVYRQWQRAQRAAKR